MRSLRRWWIRRQYGPNMRRIADEAGVELVSRRRARAFARQFPRV